MAPKCVLAPVRERHTEALRRDYPELDDRRLCHTACAFLIDQGANPKAIQARMGHATITTTLDRYGHLFDGHDDKWLDGLDAAFGAAGADNVVALS